MWVLSGLVLSIVLALVAWSRSRASTRTYYEGEVYGMGAAGHRKYALGFTVGAAAFLVELVWPGFLSGPPALPGFFPEALLALVFVTGILYLATFLRGASGEDE